MEGQAGVIRQALGGEGTFVSRLVVRRQDLLLESPASRRSNMRELTERNLLAHYTQAGARVNSHGEIMHIYGRMGKYLEPAAGDAGLSILAMAREGLRPVLTTALHQAVTHKQSVSHNRWAVWRAG